MASRDIGICCAASWFAVVVFAVLCTCFDPEFLVPHHPEFGYSAWVVVAAAFFWSVWRIVRRCSRKVVVTPVEWLRSDAASGRAWEYLKHSNQDLHGRTNYFLVAESFLIVSFTTTLAASPSLEPLAAKLRIAISVLAIVYTFVWLHVNVRLEWRFHILYSYMRADPVYYKY